MRSRASCCCPPGLSAAYERGESGTLELLLAADHSVERTRVAQQELRILLAQHNSAWATARTATEEAAKLSPFASAAARQAYFDGALGSARARQAAAPITIRSERATRQPAPLPSAAEQASAGQLVTFALVTLLATSAVLVGERSLGTLRRLLLAPLSKGTILMGKVLGRLLIGIAQMSVLIVAGQVLFGVRWGQSPAALAALVLAFALAAVALGLFLATIVRSSEQAGHLTTGAAMLLAAVGGAWWPLEVVGSRFLQVLALLLPSGWAMRGFQAVILRGAGLAEVLPTVAVLLGFALLFFGLGVWRFRFE